MLFVYNLSWWQVYNCWSCSHCRWRCWLTSAWSWAPAHRTPHPACHDNLSQEQPAAHPWEPVYTPAMIWDHRPHYQPRPNNYDNFSEVSCWYCFHVLLYVVAFLINHLVTIFISFPVGQNTIVFCHICTLWHKFPVRNTPLGLGTFLLSKPTWNQSWLFNLLLRYCQFALCEWNNLKSNIIFDHS